MASVITAQLSERAAVLWDRVNGLASGELDVEAVHDIRVACKRLRACWLVRWKCTGEQDCDTQERALRAITKPLSLQRDQDVALETCERLVKRAEGESLKALHGFADTLRVETGERLVRQELLLTEPLSTAHAVWQDGLNDCDDEGLSRGLLRLYVKARRWWQRASNAEHKAELQHRWRRWVKHCYFAADATGLLKETQKSLKQLGSLLGKRNDLDVLKGMLDTRISGDEHALVLALIEAEDQALVQRCSDLGRACFKSKRLEMAATLGL